MQTTLAAIYLFAFLAFTSSSSAQPRIDLLGEYTLPQSAPGDRFGSVIAPKNSHQYIVGAPLADIDARDSGAAYVFWVHDDALVHTLLPPKPQAGARFGSALAGLGNLVAVGAPYEDQDGVRNTGVVYLFDTNADQPPRVLTNPAPQANDLFGESLAFLPPRSGRSALLAVGASRDNSTDIDAGSVYFYDADTGQLRHALVLPDGAKGDRFGLALAALGDSLLIGAPGRGAGGIKEAGAAYLVDSAGEIIQTYSSPDPQAGGNFGQRVATAPRRFDQVSDIGIAGAPGEGPGAVYSLALQTGDILDPIPNPEPATSTDFGAGALVGFANYVLVGHPTSFGGGAKGAGAAFLQTLSGQVPATTLAQEQAVRLAGFAKGAARVGPYLVIGTGGTNTVYRYAIGPEMYDLGEFRIGEGARDTRTIAAISLVGESVAMNFIHGPEHVSWNPSRDNAVELHFRPGYDDAGDHAIRVTAQYANYNLHMSYDFPYTVGDRERPPAPDHPRLSLASAPAYPRSRVHLPLAIDAAHAQGLIGAQLTLAYDGDQLDLVPEPADLMLGSTLPENSFVQAHVHEPEGLYPDGQRRLSIALLLSSPLAAAPPVAAEDEIALCNLLFATAEWPGIARVRLLSAELTYAHAVPAVRPDLVGGEILLRHQYLIDDLNENGAFDDSDISQANLPDKAQPLMRADFNYDRRQDLGDALELQRRLLARQAMAPLWHARHDLNIDGYFNRADVNDLLRRIVRVRANLGAKAAGPPARLDLAPRARGEMLIVPVQLTAANRVNAFELTLGYDPSRLTLERVVPADGGVYAATPAPGTVELFGLDHTPLEGQLAELHFKAADRAAAPRLLAAHLLDDQGHLIPVARTAAVLPAQPRLHPNFPNPFNPSTTLAFELPHAGRATLDIFNAGGQRIRRLVDAPLAAGRHSFAWQARDQQDRPLAAGVYFYRLRLEDGPTYTRSMLLLK